MGICASCFGRDSHSMQDADESDPLFVDSQNLQYGAINEHEAPPDEEDLRREREALARITAEAADNMIDISHPSAADLTQYHSAAHTEASESEAEQDGDADADETAWLQSLNAEDAVEIKGLHREPLVLDISQLRPDQHSDGGSEGGNGVGGAASGGAKKNVIRAMAR